MILIHGTTRHRAELIIQYGPNPSYREPGGQDWTDGFSMNVESGPFLFRHPEDYARGKALAFPNEGGPAILVVDVPAEVIQLALSDLFPLSQGLVQFDIDAGLDELIAVWSGLHKEIRSLP